MRRRTHDAAFTLMEMMAVVVIVGILAAIAITSYKKWIRESKSSEVTFVMGHFQTREEAFRNENGTYLATGADDTAVFPDSAGLGDSGSSISTRPAEWTQLKIDTGKDALYCGYVVVAGAAGTAPTGTAAGMWPNPPTTEWFYVHAECNWNNDSTDGNEQWWVRGDQALSTVHRENRGK